MKRAVDVFENGGAYCLAQPLGAHQIVLCPGHFVRFPQLTAKEISHFNRAVGTKLRANPPKTLDRTQVQMLQTSVTFQQSFRPNVNTLPRYVSLPTSNSRNLALAETAAAGRQKKLKTKHISLKNRIDQGFQEMTSRWNRSRSSLLPVTASNVSRDQTGLRR